jgi:hypothetical protein
VERRERHLQEGRKDCVMRIFMLGTPRDIFLERSIQEREHLKYEGKLLNKRNFIIKCKEKYMHKEKSYFGTQNGSLAICHTGFVTIEQYEPAQ